MLTELKTNKLSGTPATLMTLGYSFTATTGNLDSRSNNAFATTWSEDFDYDELDRLTDFNDNNGSRSQSYEGSGRIASNSRLGTYTYGSNPYQQTGLSSLTDYAKYHYQNDPLQEITYNAFKAPTRIQEQGKERIDFQYNGGLSRSTMYYGSEDTARTARPFRRHYSEDGSVEITEDLTNSKTSFIFYLGGDAYSAPAIWKYQTSGAGTTDGIYYLFRDHIGSINLITDDSGNAVEKRQFDAWGQVVKLEDGSGNPLTSFQITDRGYTGHEHLLGVGLINMNARLYDPILHRFLGPDNNIQEPGNTQSYNRYGYVWNNPLRYTDPSGELVDGSASEDYKNSWIYHLYEQSQEGTDTQWWDSGDGEGGWRSNRGGWYDVDGDGGTPKGWVGFDKINGLAEIVIPQAEKREPYVSAHTREMQARQGDDGFDYEKLGAAVVTGMDAVGISMNKANVVNKVLQGTTIESKAFKAFTHSGTVIGAIAGGGPALYHVLSGNATWRDGAALGLAGLGIASEFFGVGEIWDGTAGLIIATGSLTYDVWDATHPVK